MRPHFIPRLTSLALFALVSCATPGRAASISSPRLEFAAGAGANYDSNILQYSDEQLQLFEGGTRPDEFSIQTRDDMVWTPYAALMLDQRRSDGRRRSLRVRVDADFHSKNSTADFHSVLAQWREGFGGGRRLLLSYYLLPHYYLRQLFDPNAIVPYRGLSKYRRAEFQLQVATAIWSQRLNRSALFFADYHYEHRDYNREFRERTSGANQVEGQLAFDRLPRHGNLLASAGYRTSAARAGEYVDSGTGVLTPFPDVGYHGLISRLAVSAELARSGGWHLQGTLGYELETRDFTSSIPSDRYHYHRKDVLNAGDAELKFGLGRHWTLRGTARTEFNHAKIDVALPATSSGDAGSYRKHQAALAIDWTGNLWRGDRAAGAGDEQ